MLYLNDYILVLYLSIIQTIFHVYVINFVLIDLLTFHMNIHVSFVVIHLPRIGLFGVYIKEKEERERKKGVEKKNDVNRNDTLFHHLILDLKKVDG